MTIAPSSVTNSFGAKVCGYKILTLVAERLFLLADGPASGRLDLSVRISIFEKQLFTLAIRFTLNTLHMMLANRLLVFCIVLSFSLGLSGQSEAPAKKEVVFMNSKIIDPIRYDRFVGSPYWFKEWRKAKIISNKFVVIEGVEVNFNGDTREVEVKRDDEYLELQRSYYLRIEMAPLPGEGEEPLIFQRGFHPAFGDKFMQILYRSADMVLVKEFYTNRVEPHIETIHGSDSKFRFAKIEALHLCINGNCKPMTRKNWPILKLFDQSPAIKNYLKEKKPNLKSDDEVIKLIKFYESDVLGKG